MSYLSNNWARLYFSIAILLLAFAYGIAVGKYRLFPYKLIDNGLVAARDLIENADQYARVRPGKHLRTSRRAGAGVSRYQPDLAYNGITLLSGMWNETLGIKLVNMDGDLLHEWTASVNEIWPQAEHLLLQPHDWDTSIHGMWAQPNGDIIFNFEHNGLVSINACSEVNWKQPIKSHHVVHHANTGNLWVADSLGHKEGDARFPGLAPPFYEELLTELTPDGEIIRKLSLLEIIYNSGYEALLLDAAEYNSRTADGWQGMVATTRMDITHLNDIEILRPDIADAFPLFEAGDIMLSLRNLDLILVVDGKTNLIKWSMTGPWLLQHDPDFLPDGNIMLFDNRALLGKPLGTHGSRILTIDPVSRDVRVAYQGSTDDVFFSSQMGKQQPLANGNILIAEADGGRAFEVATNGEITWEYINRWSDDRVAVITQAIRLPTDYFQLSSAQCN